MDEWLFSKEWAAKEILSILQRNDKKYAMNLLIHAQSLEKTAQMAVNYTITEKGMEYLKSLERECDTEKERDSNRG